MKLPKLITDLIDAQNDHDAQRYASLFLDSAIVFDEGKTYKGRAEIEEWIDKANKQNHIILTAVAYEEYNEKAVFRGEISGNFPGSPAKLKFNLGYQNGLIQSMQITE